MHKTSTRVFAWRVPRDSKYRYVHTYIRMHVKGTNLPPPSPFSTTCLSSRPSACFTRTVPQGSCKTTDNVTCAHAHAYANADTKPCMCMCMLILRSHVVYLNLTLPNPYLLDLTFACLAQGCVCLLLFWCDKVATKCTCVHTYIHAITHAYMRTYARLYVRTYMCVCL